MLLGVGYLQGESQAAVSQEWRGLVPSLLGTALKGTFKCHLPRRATLPSLLDIGFLHTSSSDAAEQ